MKCQFLLTSIGALALAACQSVTAQTPAVFETADAETMDAVKDVLRGAMNDASVTLGAGDPTREPVIAVLPPRLSPQEDRSPATPTLFDIVTDGANCILVRRETGETYKLNGVACRPV